jgi:hypothetical protein
LATHVGAVLASRIATRIGPVHLEAGIDEKGIKQDVLA